MKYFELLGIWPARLKLDLKELEEKYYQASLATHPDKNPNQADAHLVSAELNRAYKTLKDKWSRAEYVLNVNKLSADSKLPPSLAELYFEAQEFESSEALTSLKVKLNEELKARDIELEKIFQDFDGGADRIVLFQRLKELVIEHKYAISMLRDLEEKLKVK